MRVELCTNAIEEPCCKRKKWQILYKKYLQVLTCAIGNFSAMSWNMSETIFLPRIIISPQ